MKSCIQRPWAFLEKGLELLFSRYRYRLVAMRSSISLEWHFEEILEQDDVNEVRYIEFAVMYLTWNVPA